MNSINIVLILFFLFSFMFPGCKDTEKKAQGKPAVLATVNGVPITGDEIDMRLGGHDKFFDSAAKGKALDAIIAEELMYQKGVQLGFDKDPKFQSDICRMALKVTAYKRAEMARRVRDTQIASHVTVIEQEVKDYYAKHADEIGTDLHLGIIQFANEIEAKEALVRIRAGTPFEKIVVEQFAHVPKMRRAWDKGFMHWDQMPAAFAEDVYQLKKGDVSDVLISSPAEAYLVKVIDKKKNQAGEFDCVKATIQNRLWAAKGKEAYENYTQQLKKDASIKKR